jgi:2,3-dihydroxybiphenyl 1,2-dioxygenase
MNEIELAFVGIEVPDPASLDAFFGEVIGLVPGDAPHTWRNDGRVHRILVEAGDANDAAFVGFEARDAEAFERTRRRLDEAGFATTEGSEEDRRARRVDRLARTTSPWGVPVELVLGLASAASPFASPSMPGGFLTEGVGFVLAVIATPALDDAHRHLVVGLGRRPSGCREVEIAAGIELEVRFYHCNARHHTVAMAKAPFELPQRLHHLMFETKERDDVGAAFDRVWATDLAIPNGLGRHDNDGMFSFYVASPAGFQVEVGHGAKVVGDDWSENRRYDRISAWGHQPLRG